MLPKSIRRVSTALRFEAPEPTLPGMDNAMHVERFTGRFPLGAIEVASLVGEVNPLPDGSLDVRLGSLESSEFWLEFEIRLRVADALGNRDREVNAPTSSET